MTATSCADSHTDFLQKRSNSMWLNSEFFVSFPFKENIQTAPLLQHANEECDQHVNNRAEQARGKLRLVINYKPLNQYLQDIKFPLPNKSALLQYFQGATIFFKQKIRNFILPPKFTSSMERLAFWSQDRTLIIPTKDRLYIQACTPHNLDIYR